MKDQTLLQEDKIEVVQIDGTNIKLILLTDLIREMQKIEYKLDDLNNFGNKYPEHYFTMWESLKLSIIEKIKEANK